MTQNRTRAGRATPAPQPVPTVPADPLAAFREPEPEDRGGPLPDVIGSPELETPPVEGDTPPEVPGARALITPDDQDEAVRQAVTAMHADLTTLGFLHKGSVCGCGYIARVIVQTVLPASLPDAVDPELAEACERFHPGEECRPGDNHPGAA